MTEASSGGPARVDPVLAALTAPGTPFEIAVEGGRRFFRRMPASVSALIETARRFGKATFVVEGENRLTFDDVFVRREALAALLAIKPGDHVAIAMRNSIPWMIAFLAVMRRGGVAVLLNSRSSGAEMRAAAEECAAKIVLADDSRARALKDAGYGGPIMEARAFPTAGACDAPAPAPAADDPATILFTSGTTGRMKGAVLSHANLMTGLMCVQLSGAVILTTMARQHNVAPEAIIAKMPQSAQLLVSPLFHISGLGSGFLSPLLSGGKVVIMRRWDAQEALRLIPEETITVLTAVPTMLWDLLHRAHLAAANISSLTQISTGGQAIPHNLLDAIQEACPRAFLGSGFGLTETAGAVAMSTGADFMRKRASAGRVLTLAEVRTLDEGGAPLPAGETGEISVRGPMVMGGYWNQPEETARVLSADGWFRTGDVGYVDDESYIFIVDRKKDMVISGGENIYCAEVERAMSLIPGVAEGAAFGLPDERLGERLVAVVVGKDLTEAGVRGHVGRALADYKAPVRVGLSAEPLPRNAIGKIDKIKLRAHWGAALGEH